MSLNRRLRMGMVGGGPGAFIGEVHRKALRIDGKVDIVSGVFSSNIEKSKQMGRELFLDPVRVYGSYKEMIKKELSLSEDQRIDFVTITTPNNSHFPIAKAFLEAGFNVMCEKPMTINVQEAKELAGIVEKSGKVFGLMHNYTGYPMVKLARDMVRKNELGKIRKIVVQYPQGWLANALEKTDSKQAQWRTDPKRSGGSGCGGDIGTHAENLAEYVTGLKMTHICAELTTFVEGRMLDDDVNCIVKFENGAKGILHASQISVGEENDLAIWVYGKKGGIEWHQETPNHLKFKPIDGPEQVWKRGNDYVNKYSNAAERATRLPFGHPEAFIEAMSNVYCNFADTIIAKLKGEEAEPIIGDFPDVYDGIRGMQFIETILKSAESDLKWIPFEV